MLPEASCTARGLSRLAHHNDRIADSDFGMLYGAVWPGHSLDLGGIERLLQEPEEVCDSRNRQIGG